MTRHPREPHRLYCTAPVEASINFAELHSGAMASQGSTVRRRALESTSEEASRQRLSTHDDDDLGYSRRRQQPHQGQGAGSRPTSPFFKHNSRVWAMSGPCLAVLLLLGGRSTALIAALGVMACYCFDLADNAEGALVSIWTVVICCSGMMAWAAASLGKMHVITVVFFLVLVGMWCTLQFGWIYREDPDLARIFERMLFGCLPLPAASIITWAAVVLGGPGYVAPCIGLTLYAAVSLYLVPLPCGGGGGGAGGVHGDASRSAPVVWVCLLLLPAMVQIGVDHRLLLRVGGDGRGESLLRVVWAAALPWPMLLSLRGRRVLWWAGPRLRRKINKTLGIAGPIALLILWETSKTLVVLPTFRPYLYLAPKAPYDSLLLSGSIYLLIAASFAQKLGRRGVLLGHGLTILSVRCLAMLLGLGQYGFPLFDLSTLWLFVVVFALFFSGRGDLRAYAAGVTGLSSFITWFSSHTMGHLKFHFVLPTVGRPGEERSSELLYFFSSHPRTLSLDNLCLCCACLALSVLLVPGLAALQSQKVWAGMLFSVHGVALMLVEIVLIGAEAGAPWQLHGLYPLPLAALTGALGAWMAFRLLRERGLDSLYLWLPGSVNVAKVLACLVAGFAPTNSASAELSYLSTVVPMTALIMAGTAPFALFKARSTNTSQQIESQGGGGGGMRVARDVDVGSSDWTGPMEPFEGIICVFFMANALWVCSEAIISPLLREFIGGGVYMGGKNTGRGDGGVDHYNVTAFCGVLLGVYVLGIVSAHFPDSVKGRRIGAALLMASMAVFTLQPSLAVFGRESAGDVSAGMSRAGFRVPTIEDHDWREFAKQTCGVFMASTCVLGITGIVSATKTLTRRAVFAVFSAGSLGVWSALSSLPHADIAVVMWSVLGAAGTFTCAAMILAEAALPRQGAYSSASRREGGRSGTRAKVEVMLELYVGAVAFMPVTAVAQAVMMLIFGPIGRHVSGGSAGGAYKAHGAARFAVTTMAGGHAVIALALKFFGSGSAFGGGMKGSGSKAGGTADRWIPVIGNVSTIIATAMTVVSCWIHLPGEMARSVAAVPCCLLLLLLQNDGRLFGSGVGFGNAVPMGALSSLWAGSAAYYVLLKGSLQPKPFMSSPPMSLLAMFGGLAGGTIISAYRGALHHFHGVYGSTESRAHGEVAVALRAVSFWTAESPWQPLWNLLLLLVTIPSHARWVLFLWGGEGSSQRRGQIVAALAINVLPLFAGDLISINFMGLAGFVGGVLQLWLSHEREVASRRFI